MFVRLLFNNVVTVTSLLQTQLLIVFSSIFAHILWLINYQLESHHGVHTVSLFQTERCLSLNSDLMMRFMYHLWCFNVGIIRYLGSVVSFKVFKWYFMELRISDTHRATISALTGGCLLFPFTSCNISFSQCFYGPLVSTADFFFFYRVACGASACVL